MGILHFQLRDGARHGEERLRGAPGYAAARHVAAAERRLDPARLVQLQSRRHHTLP